MLLPRSAAEAFDKLRDELSRLHAAVEGLTAAKEKMPDYSPTLRDMAARLDHIDQRIESIHDKPAMRLTPLTLAAESHDASRSLAPRTADRSGKLVRSWRGRWAASRA